MKKRQQEQQGAQFTVSIDYKKLKGHLRLPTIAATRPRLETRNAPAPMERTETCQPGWT